MSYKKELRGDEKLSSFPEEEPGGLFFLKIQRAYRIVTIKVKKD